MAVAQLVEPRYSIPVKLDHPLEDPATPASSSMPETHRRENRLIQVFIDHRDKLILVALSRVRDYHIAEDVYQNAATKACEFDSTDVKHPEAYATRMVRNFAINHATRAQARKPLGQIHFSALDIATFCDERLKNPPTILIEQERDSRLLGAVLELDPLHRKTATMYYLDGETIESIAEQLATPIGTIKRRLHTARSRLAEKLWDDPAILHERYENQ